MAKKRIRLVEVGLRDGLQNETKHLTVAQRLTILSDLVAAGQKDVELGAFVSPKWVPQMSGTTELVNQALKLYPSRKGFHFSALVPNDKGYEDARKTSIKEIAVFLACSESFSQKNINCSIEESFVRAQSVLAKAKKDKLKVRGYLSVCFGCPYEGAIDPKRVIKIAERLIKMGVYEISFGDTIGIANPKQVRGLIQGLKKKLKLTQMAMHFHDTRGTALANTLVSAEAGITSFDSSIGGLGGCPYAPGSLGNVATEDMVYLLHSLGYFTGLNLRRLVELNKKITEMMGKSLPSRVGALSPSKFE